VPEVDSLPEAETEVEEAAVEVAVEETEVEAVTEAVEELAEEPEEELEVELKSLSSRIDMPVSLSPVERRICLLRKTLCLVRVPTARSE
jgi:hypothetical protein